MDRVIDKVRSKVFIAIAEIYINTLFASLAGVTIRGCFAGPLAIGRITDATLFYYLTKHSLVNAIDFTSPAFFLPSMVFYARRESSSDLAR